jgi:Secretion system C-terminal sorting domain/PQQ-like domain
MRHFSILLFSLFTFLQLHAQSWTKTYGNNYTSIGNAAVPTADGGFAVVGYGEGIGGGKSQLQLLKIDNTGKELWVRGFGGADTDLGFDIALTKEKGFILAGSSYVDATLLRQFYVVKTNEKGDEIWSRTFGNTHNDVVFSILPTKSNEYIVAGSSQDPSNNNTDAIVYLLDIDGKPIWNVPFGGAGIQEFKKVIELADGYLCVGSSVVGKNSKGADNRDALLVKISKTGQILWSKTYGTEAYEDAQSVVALLSGGFALCGKDTSDILVTRTDANGTLLWTKKYGSNNEDEGLSILQTKDGNLVFAGSSATDASNVDGFAVKIKLDGAALWTRRVGSSQRYEAFSHVAEAKDGSLLFTGTWGSSSFLITSKTYCVKTEAEGILGNNYVQSKVFYDKNNNCKFDTGDTPLNDWLVSITKPSRSYLGMSNAKGESFTTVDSGTYKVTLLPQNSYWKQVCQTSYNVSLNEQEDTVSVDFALRPAVNCAGMEVNIATPQLLRCQSNRYVVNFCNRGTTVATNSYIDVVFDEYFDNFVVNLGSFVKNGNTIRCNIGDVPPGICGQFDIIATLDKNCNSTVLGQSHKVVAHIYPDEICTSGTANWDGSSLEVSGSCQNNKIYFKVKNTGTKGQTQARKSIIIEDDVIYRQGPVGPLNPGEEKLDTINATGKTYRLIVEQSIGHPGKSNPTVAIEGCANGTFSTGYVTQFSEDDGNPFISIDLQESKGTVNKNQKIAFPKGAKAQRYITDTTELNYQIFFNNTFGDTLRSLTIIDTLSALLNPLSIKDIQSSHRFQLAFPQANVLQFTFNDIKLPDSSANALLSSGFVKFRLSQKSNNISSSLIHNRAALFYGNQGAVLTNRVTHTVGKNFITVGAPTLPDFAKVKLKVSPNPFNDVTYLDISGLNDDVQKKFALFDMQGNLVKQLDFQGNNLKIECDFLPKGLYLFQLSQNAQLVGTGKILIN